MEFDHYTIVLLIRRDDAPKLTETEQAAIQDAHMSHLADLAEAGQLLAAGPLLHESYRGLSILAASPEEALALKQADPAVRAGIFDVVAVPWMVPAGAMSFGPARFPRSMAEAQA